MYRPKKVGSTRKKTATPRRRKSHRRMSGAKDIGGMAMNALALGLGAIGGRELNTIIVKQFPSFSPLMSGLAQAAIGFILPKFVKSPFVTFLGYGLVSNGIMVSAVSLGVIQGIGMITDRMAYNIPLNGTSRVNVIAGTRMAGTNALNTVTGPQSRVSNNVVKAPALIGRNGVNHMSY